jgi:GTP-binding protein
VAVAGRSNVGKSTLLNALVGRRQLARTSGTPGKTRLIQFYRLGDAAYLVDLPGYGYAAVGRRERAGWRALVESYLRSSRTVLRGALLLVDARRGLQREELDLLDWLARQRIPARLVLTKVDKLSRTALERERAAVLERARIAEDALAAVCAPSGRGLARVGGWIREWTGLELRRPDGSELLA